MEIGCYFIRNYHWYIKIFLYNVWKIVKKALYINDNLYLKTHHFPRVCVETNVNNNF